MDEKHIEKLVMQWLAESGYHKALAALQEECGFKYEDVEGTMEKGSELLTMLNDYYELSMSPENAERMEEREREAELLERGDGNYARQMYFSLSDVHRANILSVKFQDSFADSNLVATGSTDKSIALIDYVEKKKVNQYFIHSGAVVALDFHPTQRNLILTGSMDGTHAITDIETGSVLKTYKDHTKYVVRAKFSPDGKFVATGSYDKKANIYSCNGAELTLLKELFCVGTVEGLAFTPDSKCLIVTVRDDNYLHYVDLQTFEETKYNMNLKGDDHVSFTAMDVVCSQDGKYTLVNTDKSRLILFKSASSIQLRNMYGLTNDAYSQPRTAFDASGKYVFSTSQDFKIYTYELATQKIVNVLEAHKNVVRDIAHHRSRGILASVGFDKKINFFTADGCI